MDIEFTLAHLITSYLSAKACICLSTLPTARRQLSTDAWQIHAVPSITSNDFHFLSTAGCATYAGISWQNMIGFEFMSYNLLRQTTEQRIVLQHVPLDNAEQLSEAAAKAHRTRLAGLVQPPLPITYIRAW